VVIDGFLGADDVFLQLIDARDREMPGSATSES
jgi:hypothetical protein